MKEVYLDLLKKGVQFPPSEAEAETARQEVGHLSWAHIESDGICCESSLFERDNPTSIHSRQKGEFMRRPLPYLLK